MGVDVGGTTVATLLVDRALNPCAEITVATDLSSPDNTMEGILSAIEETLARAGTNAAELAAIGLGVPGKVDRTNGVAQLAVNLRWYDYPLASQLATRLHVPCLLENDVRVAAMGVYRFDNPFKDQNLAYVSIGTGVAAGIILDGKLLLGQHGLAGELGHFIQDPTGPLCNCGARGCLETFVSATAVIRRTREAIAAGRASVLADQAPLTARHVYDAAAAGDVLAQEIVDDVGTELGRALRNVLLAYDVDRVVLGGGVTRAGARYLAPILAEWRRQHETSALARALLRPEVLRTADPARNMGAWGAVALAAELVGR